MTNWLVFWFLLSVSAFIPKKTRTPETESEALQLLKTLWKDIVQLPKKEIDDILRGPTNSESGRIVHIARLNKHLNKLREETQKITNDDRQVSNLRNLVSEHVEDIHAELQTLTKENQMASGNTKFLVELIRRYPDLIWKVNDDNQSIFHIAVKHRHEGIYNLLYEIGTMKDMLTPLRDDNVGKTVNRKQLENGSGGALEMQRELLMEVESMIPPSYREQRNSDGLTPHELFTKEHKDMVTQGEKLMKEIAGQCIVVAALIATMVFAAAFTVPGGYDQNNGIPIFHSETTFKVFVVADAISLFSSSASILCMFLSVFTSRYAERDFLESLPRKLIVGKYCMPNTTGVKEDSYKDLAVACTFSRQTNIKEDHSFSISEQREKTIEKKI
ncbi:ankyrin repeat-containing domain, PGG domain protein [Artemisia annua]|uniref:Ankyrin repeat-containing domain, PGG domain protein n=1 Tax=Artemisia annua TaxID=35608 RepID=A0A2U1LLJ1_ARTAN|nr:ankyrin repeat-containing domain, PGG domain protein [Artemisia annua]